jgi:hypothetical protein
MADVAMQSDASKMSEEKLEAEGYCQYLDKKRKHEQLFERVARLEEQITELRQKCCEDEFEDLEWQAADRTIGKDCAPVSLAELQTITAAILRDFYPGHEKPCFVSLEAHVLRRLAKLVNASIAAAYDAAQDNGEAWGCMREVMELLNDRDFPDIHDARTLRGVVMDHFGDAVTNDETENLRERLFGQAVRLLVGLLEDYEAGRQRPAEHRAETRPASCPTTDGTEIF